jgi:glycogen synthase
MPKGCPGRVLMTTDAVGGVWQYSLELASGLCRRGVRVLLAVMGPDPSTAHIEAANAIRGLALRHRPYPLEWMMGAEANLAASAAWLADLEAAFEPDMVHINGYAQACLPWRSPVLVVCHSCVRSWWRAVRGGEPPPEWDAYGARVAEALRRADVVVAPTRSFLRTIGRLYHIRLPAACAIPNGRGGPFHVGAEKEPLVFSCGRAWDEAKGFDVVDRLAGGLPWPVCVAGSTRPTGGGARRAPAHAQVLGFLGEDELASWLARASVFVLPARYEPFGLAILEAALSGCALVLGNLDTLRELWDGDAQFVDVGDEDALRSVVIDLTRDVALRREWGARALERARRYSADRMVDGYVRAYRWAARRLDETGGGSLAVPLRGQEIGLQQ